MGRDVVKQDKTGQNREQNQGRTKAESRQTKANQGKRDVYSDKSRQVIQMLIVHPKTDYSGKCGAEMQNLHLDFRFMRKL
jgi:hypothetical protein